MIEMMQGLIDKGYAYAAGGDVYFDIGKDADYGKLCNRDPEQLEAGARIEVSDKKRNPGDFALWKSSKPGEPAWDSPWGPGRPGWHIECSAMSMKLLGEHARHPRRRPRFAVPASRERTGPVGIVHRQAVRPLLDAQRLAQDGQAAKWPASVGNVINVADAFSTSPARLCASSSSTRTTGRPSTWETSIPRRRPECRRVWKTQERPTKRLHASRNATRE